MADQLILQGLLQNTARGDRSAFESLYQETSSQLFGVCLRILRNRAAAEEVLQDAFEKIWHHASEYHQDRGNVSTWLTSIVRYRALDYLRRLKPTESLDETHGDVASDQAGPLDWAVTGAEMNALQLCLNELNDEQKQVIVMSFLEGLSHSELVQRVSSPLGTVKSWIRRGLLSLRRCLES
jgi:RNA polymerase sigma-70 factor (ECF subfamily)